jgi:hypothetical protein
MINFSTKESLGWNPITAARQHSLTPRAPGGIVLVAALT